MTSIQNTILSTVWDYSVNARVSTSTPECKARTNKIVKRFWQSLFLYLTLKWKVKGNIYKRKNVSQTDRLSTESSSLDTMSRKKNRKKRSRYYGVWIFHKIYHLPITEAFCWKSSSKYSEQAKQLIFF